MAAGQGRKNKKSNLHCNFNFRGVLWRFRLLVGVQMAFDDSIVHAVRHRGGLNRTVLIVDILHPNHPDPEAGLDDTLTDPELKAVLRRRLQWRDAQA